MSDNVKKAVEDKPKSEQELAQEFLKEYQTLCEKFQMRLVISPTYLGRDDGTFSTVLQQSVGRLRQ